MKVKKTTTERFLAHKKRVEETFQRTKRTTSLYFLLWAIFTVFTLLILIVGNFSQQFVLSNALKEQASREMAENGPTIVSLLKRGAPEWTGENYSGYIRILARYYDVDIYILDENGNVIFPLEENFDPDAPEVEETMDFSEEIKVLLSRLGENEYTMYETNNEYVYASKLQLFPKTDSYLYIGKSLRFIKAVQMLMNVRMLLVSVFILILSFVVTSAVAGWFTNPITEMTKKARRLAEGDFSVDFDGMNYGKEMVELADALNFARDELSKTDRMQKELIANVSHDFKTPLTMIKGYASMILEISGENPQKREKHARIIIEESDRLASLVNDVLNLSKISAGMVEFQYQKLDMSAYVYEILERFAYLRETKGYQFVAEIEEGLVTTADEGKMGQVLYNLIGNAVNYTGEDKKVCVRLKKEEGATFRFSVTDTGSGIKPEDMANIWDRYYRSSEFHKRPVQGTGLGLSIVKTILERHHFRYGVESELGKGSTFYVIFPQTLDRKEK